MSGGMGLEYAALSRGDENWSRVAELLRRTRSELADADTSGVAPGVRGAASSFLSAWAGYAAESAAISDGMAGALEVMVGDLQSTEQARQSAFRDLDARLGPQR